MTPESYAAHALTIGQTTSHRILYHFDRKFTDSENLQAEMADKFSFEF
jgi:hypothetical protein